MYYYHCISHFLSTETKSLIPVPKQIKEVYLANSFRGLTKLTESKAEIACQKGMVKEIFSPPGNQDTERESEELGARIILPGPAFSDPFFHPDSIF